MADPRRFLGQFPEGAILDEVQRAPELFSFLQTLVDASGGITHNTAKAWLSVLEASYLVALLPPYHRNLGKRLTKKPSSTP